MKLVSVNFNNIPLGQPLPFSLRSSEGLLLARKGYVFTEREALDTLAAHGSLFTSEDESRVYMRQLNMRLQSMAASDTNLAELADTELPPVAAHFGNPNIGPADLPPEDDGPLDWYDMQVRANALLREANSLRFMPRLDQLHRDLRLMATRQPDTTLFALIHLTAGETRYYSATHAMLVCVMCMLAAREVLTWSEELETTLGRASLTMNIAMTDLQDQLARQTLEVSKEQRQLIDTHPVRSVELLRKRGVTDPVWLAAVLYHHSATAGPLAGRIAPLQIARLIQRADGFAARLSPRATRVAMAPAHAMQATYFDESRKVDEAGASLIKALGIYPPGSFVRLASQEVGTVVRRGANSLTPRVAVLINRHGMPMAEPAIRDTRVHEYRIVANVHARDIKVRTDLMRLLTLT